MKSQGTPGLDPREVELKFQLPGGSRDIIESSSVLGPSEAQRHHLVTTYFDTPDNVLDLAGLTLRVRRSDDTFIQTVKSRTNGHNIAADRNEWEWPIKQAAPVVECLADVAALRTVATVIKDRLEPVFVTDVWRTTRQIRLPSNTLVEAAIDEGCLKVGATSEPVSELELELKGGHIKEVYRLAGELQALAPMWISGESKATRGWQLRTAQTEGARLLRMPKLEGDMPAPAAFHQLLGATLGHLVANIGSTLRGDCEALHQMRIAIREARTTLMLFEPLVDSAVAGRLNKVLRRFGGIFGAARDWDVFCLETVPAAMPDLAAGLPDLNIAAEVERQFAHAAVVKAVHGRDFTAMVVELATLAELDTSSSVTEAGNMPELLATLAPSLLDCAAGKVKRRGRRGRRLSARRMHGLRKSIKKLIFDVEAFGGLYRHHAVVSYRRRCESLEGLLGAVNDAAVTQRLALSLATTLHPDLKKAVQDLVQRENTRARKIEDEVRPAMKAFRTATEFWS